MLKHCSPALTLSYTLALFGPLRHLVTFSLPNIFLVLKSCGQFILNRNQKVYTKNCPLNILYHYKLDIDIARNSV